MGIYQNTLQSLLVSISFWKEENKDETDVMVNENEVTDENNDIR